MLHILIMVFTSDVQLVEQKTSDSKRALLWVLQMFITNGYFRVRILSKCKSSQVSFSYIFKITYYVK